jgi:hypothetical protein
MNAQQRSLAGMRIDKRRRAIAALIISGITSQYQIAERLGITRQTCASDIKAVREQWRADMVAMFEHAKEEQLKRIDSIEAKARDAYEQSRQPKIRQQLNGEPIVTYTRPGDCKFLDLARKCCEDRRKLMGLDEPEQINIRGEVTVAAVQLQRTIESSGEYIEYRRQLAFGRPAIAGPNGDIYEQRQVEASQTFDVAGYPLGKNGNGESVAARTNGDRSRNRIDQGGNGQTD